MRAPAAELFERYHLAIFRYLLKMTGRTDVAEDLAQELFVRVVRGANTPDPGDGARAWLFRIARNLLIDWQRHAARSPVVEDAGQEPASPPGHDVALEVQQALRQLPDADREAFLLRIVGGLGHEEIASVSGVTAASVRSRIFRARSALRAALAPALPGQRPTGRLKVVP